MFKWGILSTAKIGRELLIPAIQTSSNGEVYAIASRDLTKAEALARQCGAPVAYGTYEELLNDPEVDGVYIPLHTSGHIEWSIKAAEAGKHVLCEKPMSLNASEIDPLIALRDQKGLVISEAFMVTYHPQWALVRKLIAEGAIGNLRHVDGAFSYFLKDADNMRNQVDLGGGALLDIGVYPTVTTRFATGAEPNRLRASIERDPDFGTDRYVRVEAEFEAFNLVFYLSTQMAQRQQMVFHGDEGYIQLDTPFNARIHGAAEVSLWNQKHDKMQKFPFFAVDQYRLQMEEFVRATQGNGTVFSLENSQNNQRVIDAAFASDAAGGEWITFE